MSTLKAFFVLAFILALVPAEPVRADGPNLGILIYRYDDAYISTVRGALEKSLEGKAAFIMQDGKNDQAIQNGQLEEILEGKLDGLIVNMVNPQDIDGVLDRIMAKGVPVVFFNREPDLNVLKSYDKAVFIGTNAADAGKMQGDIVKALWVGHPEYDLNQDGQFQFVMFKGEPTNPEAIARTEWSVKQAELNGVKMAQLGQTYVCNWDAALAQAAMESALAAYEGGIELVICNNDSMAMGAIAALANIGYNLEGGDKFIPVIGVDATDQAIEAINKGVMSGTVKQDGQAMGQAIAAVILNLVTGRPPLEGTGYRFDDSGLAVRIPYSPYLGAK